MAEASTIKVWDPLVRVAHWGLVAAFATAYLTEGEPEWLHVWAGYGVAGIVVVRVFWGLIGPQNARFSNFVTGPIRASRYFFALIGRRAERHVGHSPAGGLMVVALILALSVTAFSGMALYAAEEGRGPLSSVISMQTRAGQNISDDDDEEHGDSLWKEVHETAANVTLALVILHIGGVLLASIAHRENLARAMITGRKRV